MTCSLVPPLLSVLLSVLVARVYGCPEVCRCVGNRGSTVTVCAGQNLTGIPEGIPSDTEELLLKGNRIHTLRQNAFEGLTALRTLVMTNCGIEQIEPNAFAGLKHLGSLDLGANSIVELEAYTFSGLFHLKRLDLRNNALEVVHNFAFTGLNLSVLSMEFNPELRDLSVKAFHNSQVGELLLYNSSLSSQSTRALGPLQASLRDLRWDNNREQLDLPHNLFVGFSFKSLNLNFNGIRDVGFLKNVITDELSLEGNPLGAIDFSQFPNLRMVGTLHLGYTNFFPVHAQYFSDMSHLRNLYLSHNGITTLSESLRGGVLDRLHRLGIEENALHCNCEMVWFKRWLQTTTVSVSGAVCASPSPALISEMDEKDLLCVAPNVVVISRNFNISVTDEVSFTCVAEGDPAPLIKWYLPDGQVMTTPPPESRDITENLGVLKLKSTSEADAGAYRCVASNLAGNASDVARLDVYKVIRSSGSSASSLQTSSLLLPVILVICLWRSSVKLA